MIDLKTRESKGVGFARMESHAAAINAISKYARGAAPSHHRCAAHSPHRALRPALCASVHPPHALFSACVVSVR
jgi:hypothetical protein